MEIKTYDPEQHEEYLPDVYKPSYKSPEEFSGATNYTPDSSTPGEKTNCLKE